MRGPEAVFKIGERRPFQDHLRRKARRVDFLDRGREDEIRRDARQPVDVRRKRARIAREVFIRAELRGIDENRDDDAVGRPSRRLDKRQMAGVQRAHRRHQADSLASGAPRANVAAQFVDRADDRNLCIHGPRPDCRRESKLVR
jgi:hypothetical protein